MNIEQVFAEGGVLSHAFPSYRLRTGQVEMAKKVHAALEGGHAVLEAGAGIGKTFAYLTPIIQSGAKALVSTATRALQDQLIEKDVPALSMALNRSIDVVVLKGRRNYLCHLAMETTRQERLFADNEEEGWQCLQQFANTTQDGDIRHALDIATDSPLWNFATSTSDSCGVQSCSHYSDCYLYRARARARHADIVIVNHHLFLSDLKLKEEGVIDLLPSRDILLFDEAHLLPELAAKYFGESFSTVNILKDSQICERLLSEQEEKPPIAAMTKSAHGIIETLKTMAQSWPDSRQGILQLYSQPLWQKAIKRLCRQQQDFFHAISPFIGFHKSIASVARRTLQRQMILERWLQFGEQTDAQMEYAYWVERTNPHLSFYLVPLTGAEKLAKQWQQTKTAVFTSATLSIDGKFDDFCESMGLSDMVTACWDSPYDFPHRTLFYLPKGLPSVNDENHTHTFIQAALPLICGNKGRAFVLFSSLRAMREGSIALRSELEEADIKLFVQGECSNDELLRRFREAEKGVLVGSLSFWQGVDVKGQALSLVIVDKIPFTSPADPLLAARNVWRKQRGEDVFMRNQLPPAIILMKQVVGRLIRDYDDYGVFMLGDSRLQTRGYGRLILRSLPPMKFCQDEKKAISFLKTKES